MANKIREKNKTIPELNDIKKKSNNSNSVPKLKAEVSRLADIVIDISRKLDNLIG